MHKGILNLFDQKSGRMIPSADHISADGPADRRSFPISRNDQNRRKQYPDAAAGNLPLQLDYDSAVRLDAFASRRHLRI